MNVISCRCQAKGKACQEAAQITVSAQLVRHAAIPSRGKRRRKRMMNNMSMNMKIGMRRDDEVED